MLEELDAERARSKKLELRAAKFSQAERAARGVVRCAPSALAAVGGCELQGEQGARFVTSDDPQQYASAEAHGWRSLHERAVVTWTRRREAQRTTVAAVRAPP